MYMVLHLQIKLCLLNRARPSFAINHLTTGPLQNKDIIIGTPEKHIQIIKVASNFQHI